MSILKHKVKSAKSKAELEKAFDDTEKQIFEFLE